MFKAVDRFDGREVIILDRLGQDELEVLRQKARDGQLRCPVCTHELTVRAGEVRVWHFAHRHLDNCPSQNEPAELLQGRAILYRWLKGHFADGVTIEKQLDGIRLPRSIDCWVEAGGHKLAYWIVYQRMHPGDRELVVRGIEEAGATRLFLFLSNMMDRHAGCERDALHLSTTEREYLCRTGYDLLYADGTDSGRSLHYLDITTETLLTFRAMHCVEEPNFYEGVEIRTPLRDVKVSTTSGQFYHGDERDRYIAYKVEQDRRARKQAEIERRKVETMRKVPVSKNGLTSAHTARPDPEFPVAQATPLLPAWTSEPKRSVRSVDPAREGVCDECGRRTTDWAWFNGKTGTLPVQCLSAQASGEGWSSVVVQVRTGTSAVLWRCESCGMA